MKKSLNKLFKIFIFTLFFVFIFNAFFSFFGYLTCESKSIEIYVDDNSAGPWDGTIAHPYQNIQDAIDNANNSNIINIYPGTYFENLIINKSLSLVGIDNPIIDGDNDMYTFFVDCRNFNITGFIIQNCRIGLYLGGATKSFNNYISNNTFTNCDDGIYIQNSSGYNHITNNNFSNNVRAIRLYNSSNNNIVFNHFNDHSKHAINLFEQSTNNNISFNHIKYSGGVILNRWSNDNIIYNNQISQGQIQLDHCSNNKIINNEITDAGYSISLIKSNDNIISYNTINDCEVGIFLDDSENNVVSPNSFSNNGQNIKENPPLPNIKTPGFELFLFFFGLFCFIFLSRKR